MFSKIVVSIPRTKDQVLPTFPHLPTVEHRQQKRLQHIHQQTSPIFFFFESVRPFLQKQPKKAWVATLPAIFLNFSPPESLEFHDSQFDLRIFSENGLVQPPTNLRCLEGFPSYVAWIFPPSWPSQHQDDMNAMNHL